MRILVVLLFLISPELANAQTPAEALKSTLIVLSADGSERFLGSAFVFSTKTTAITNAHVVGNSQDVLVRTIDGRLIAAQVSGRDKLRDLAVLKLEEEVQNVLHPAHNIPFPGQVVYASGAPLQASFTLTAGVVSALDRQVDPVQPVGYIQHSAPVNPGSSGGPLVDETGQVIGVNSRIADGSRFFVGIAYAIPVRYVRALLREEPRNSVSPPGFRVRPLNQRMRAALGVEGNGVLIDHVGAGSPAAMAGISAGDILTHLNAQPIERPGDIAFAIASLTDDRDVVVNLLRLSGPVSVNLVLNAARQPLEPAAAQPVYPRQVYSLADLGVTVFDDGTIDVATENGVGFYSGLTTGDRILAVDGVETAQLGADWPDQFQVTKPVLFLIAFPDGATQHALLDPWETKQGFRPVGGANVLDQEVVSFE